MAILKKDGTWDIVYRVFSPQYLLEDAKINMGDFEFHYDQSEYARTCDGYLRGVWHMVRMCLAPSLGRIFGINPNSM